MLLTCLSKRDSFYMDKEEVQYIEHLISKTKSEIFSWNILNNEKLDTANCIEIGYTLKNHIDKNRIFELNVNGFKKPYVINNDKDIPEGSNALSISSVKLISSLAKFLIDRRRGVLIT